MDVIEKTAYQCGKCNKKAYFDRQLAEDCCKPRYCEDCGKELDPKWYRTVCEPCHITRLFSKAEKLTEWDGWVYREGYGYNDGYFSSVDELLQYCEDEGEDPPEWVFVCSETKHELDTDNILENMLDDAYEGARDHLVDEKELYDFIEAWNKKQYVTSYYPDYKKVLIIEKEGVKGNGIDEKNS